MRRIIYSTMMFIALWSCQSEELIQEEDGTKSGIVSTESALKGHIRVKFTQEAVNRLSLVTSRSGAVTTGLEDVDLVGVDLSTYKMQRVFRNAGKNEALLEEAGLHLWYDIYFDEQIATRSALDAYASLDEITQVDIVPEVRLCDYQKVEELKEPLASLLTPQTTADDEVVMPYNDPRLPEMWHYDNRGESINKLTGAIAGADINLFEAWKEETGSRNVIVAVMDGGIQYNHPDLADNMWVNEAELNGTPGVDDDNNGYVDDIYGWNFVTKSGIITQYEHGTHCAGTISAVNNNGKGICGIAGGTGKRDGVRLMSCQFFHTDPETGLSKAYADPDAYIYAALNGAVISSNSWTNGEGSETAFLGSAMRTAIDFFIEKAGKNAAGQQVGPMAGGLVVFAAANRGSDTKDWPAAYEKCFTTAAMAHNFKIATYSNYGSWVDITAPGGEISYGDKYAILSTTINNGYAWLQGTSMACPHLSGCAALVLSKFQGPGYTPDDIRARLENTSKNIEIFNPQYIGKMGVGYVDLGAALTPPSSEKPEVSPLVLVDAYDNWAIVEWEVKEASDGPMNKYELYWNNSSVVPEDNDMDPDYASGVKMKSYDVKFMKSGVIIRDTIKNLDLENTYYFSLRCFDRWGKASNYATEVSKKILMNNAPELTASWNGEQLLEEGEQKMLSLQVNEKEGQHYTLRCMPEISWMRINAVEGGYEFVLTPSHDDQGKYVTIIEVEDVYGKKSSVELKLDVTNKVIAPTIIKAFSAVSIKSKSEGLKINLSDYFVDLNGEKLRYEVESLNTAIALVRRNNDILTIDPRQIGYTEILVRAINESNLSASQRFEINVYTGDIKHQENMTAFPNPVRTDLNIMLADELQGEATVRVYRANGSQVIVKKANIDRNGYTINMEGLSAGTYLLSVKHKNGVEKKNIIKL